MKIATPDDILAGQTGGAIYIDSNKMDHIVFDEWFDADKALQNLAPFDPTIRIDLDMGDNQGATGNNPYAPPEGSYLAYAPEYDKIIDGSIKIRVSYVESMLGLFEPVSKTMPVSYTYVDSQDNAGFDGWYSPNNGYPQSGPSGLSNVELQGNEFVITHVRLPIQTGLYVWVNDAQGQTQTIKTGNLVTGRLNRAWENFFDENMISRIGFFDIFNIDDASKLPFTCDELKTKTLYFRSFGSSHALATGAETSGLNANAFQTTGWGNYVQLQSIDCAGVNEPPPPSPPLPPQLPPPSPSPPPPSPPPLQVYQRLEYVLENNGFPDSRPAGTQSVATYAPGYQFLLPGQETWYIKTVAAQCAGSGAMRCDDASKTKISFNIGLKADTSVFEKGLKLLFDSTTIEKDHYLQLTTEGAIRWVSVSDTNNVIHDIILPYQNGGVTLPFYESSSFSVNPSSNFYFTVMPLVNDGAYLNKNIEVNMQAAYFRDGTFGVSDFATKTFKPTLRNSFDSSQNPIAMPGAFVGNFPFCSSDSLVANEFPDCMRTCQEVASGSCCGACNLIEFPYCHLNAPYCP